MHRSILLIAALAALAAAQSSPAPVIGVFTQSASDPSQPTLSYLAASYVKYLESAGARVVPLYYDGPLSTLTTQFSQINGILYPGGGADLENPNDPFVIAAKHMFDLAIQANHNGDYFPLWVSVCVCGV